MKTTTLRLRAIRWKPESTYDDRLQARREWRRRELPWAWSCDQWGGGGMKSDVWRAIHPRAEKTA